MEGTGAVGHVREVVRSRRKVFQGELLWPGQGTEIESIAGSVSAVPDDRVAAEANEA